MQTSQAAFAASSFSSWFLLHLIDLDHEKLDECIIDSENLTTTISIPKSVWFYHEFSRPKKRKKNINNSTVVEIQTQTEKCFNEEAFVRLERIEESLSFALEELR